MIIAHVFMVLSVFIFNDSKEEINSPCYDRDYVEVSNVEYEGEKYSVVYMSRSGERVRAKYFAARDYQGNSVYERYKNWKNTNSGIVLVSSGTYWNGEGIPEGLTIDNGVMVNGALIHDRMDALTIVFATGGIVVTDLNEGNLKISGGGVDPNREFNIRENPEDLYDFKKWAQSQEATVFQTHLLVYENELKISPAKLNYFKDDPKRERRFLAVGKNEDGDIVHMIVHRPEHASFFQSTEETKNFLNDFSGMNIIFMINIDVGSQDVFELRNWDCTVNKTIKGQKDMSIAANLLVYYFK